MHKGRDVGVVLHGKTEFFEEICIPKRTAMRADAKLVFDLVAFNEKRLADARVYRILGIRC